MIYVKTPEEIQLVKAACQLTSQTLAEVAKAIQPGVTTQHLDNIARQYAHYNQANIIAHFIRMQCLRQQVKTHHRGHHPCGKRQQ